MAKYYKKFRAVLYFIKIDNNGCIYVKMFSSNDVMANEVSALELNIILFCLENSVCTVPNVMLEANRLI